VDRRGRGQHDDCRDTPQDAADSAGTAHGCHLTQVEVEDPAVRREGNPPLARRRGQKITAEVPVVQRPNRPQACYARPRAAEQKSACVQAPNEPARTDAPASEDPVDILRAMDSIRAFERTLIRP
jgi:hypothetical protein